MTDSSPDRQRPTLDVLTGLPDADETFHPKTDPIQSDSLFATADKMPENILDPEESHRKPVEVTHRDRRRFKACKCK